MRKLAFMVVSVIAIILLPQSTGAATIDVNGTAAMDGSYGLEVICNGVDTSGAYVQDDSPNAEATYRASFMFNPAQMAITQTGFILDSRHFIFTVNGEHVNGTNVRVVGIYLLKKSGKYWLAAQGRNTAAGATKTTPRIELGDAGVENSPHLVEVEWQAAAIAGGYGVLRMRVDGGAWVEQPTIKNYTQVANIARLGIVIGLDVDSVGSHYYDDFQSFRTLAP